MSNFTFTSGGLTALRIWVLRHATAGQRTVHAFLAQKVIGRRQRGTLLVALDYFALGDVREAPLFIGLKNEGPRYAI